MKNRKTAFGLSGQGAVHVWALILLASLTACTDTAPPAGTGPEQSPPSVTVTPVIQREVADTVEHVGRTSAVERVALNARVQGVLKSREFTEGAEVTEGDLLFEIDPQEFQANRDAAAAALASAQAAYDKARKFVDRLRSVSSGGVSATALEDAESSLAQAAAQRDQAKAQLQLTDLELDYTHIKAPISGSISAASVDVGNLIGPDSGVLATIVALDPIHVSFAISERVATRLMQERFEQDLDLPELSSFTPRLELSDGGKYPHDGKLDFVANEVNSTTGTLAVRASFPNPQKLLRPGQFVTVTVQRGEAVVESVIPQSSVQQDSTGYFVLVVKDDGTVEQRRVELGDRQSIDWIVRSGLEPGEMVVFEGLQKIQPGVKVKPNTADPRAGLEE